MKNDPNALTRLNYRQGAFACGFMRNGHRLLCADGVIRAAELAEQPDTYFSIPAKIRIKGKVITGYATTEMSDTARTSVNIFRAHVNQDVAYWPEMFTPEYEAILAKGYRGVKTDVGV